MHLPDGFLDAKTAIVSAGLAAGSLGFALREMRRHLPPVCIPLLGLAAAFVFSVQMLNFPILGGTSGHLMGGVLVAILLGPSAAIVVMSAVLIIQCLVFADGGLTALGANLFNIGIVGSVSGFVIYRGLSYLLRSYRVAAFIASVVIVVFSALFCSGELALSGTVRPTLVFPVMTQFHLIIGLV